MRKIIWIDDHFHKKFYSFLLEPFVSMIKCNAIEIVECRTLGEFAAALDEHGESCDGFIIDVMLRKDADTVNFDLLGEEGKLYRATKAGIQIAEILLGLERASNPFAQKFNTKNLLLLTGEYDDPWSKYNQEHPRLTKYIRDSKNKNVAIYSKAEKKLESKLQEWKNNL